MPDIGPLGGGAPTRGDAPSVPDGESTEEGGPPVDGPPAESTAECMMGRAPPEMGASVERNPAEKQPSGVSDHGHPTSNKGGLLYREPQGAEVEVESVPQTGQNRASPHNLKPEGPPVLSETSTSVPRDRMGACHPLVCEEKGVRRCVIKDLLDTTGVQESVLQDQSPVSSRYTSDASDTDDVSVNESREPLGMYGVNLKEEEDDLLATYQGLLKKNAEMEKRVNKAEKRLMEFDIHGGNQLHPRGKP